VRIGRRIPSCASGAGFHRAPVLTVLHPSLRRRSHLVLPDHHVVEQPLGVLGYQAVLGRDVLAGCLVVYDGPAGACTLAY
jgi:hypothetical protein